MAFFLFSVLSWLHDALPQTRLYQTPILNMLHLTQSLVRLLTQWHRRNRGNRYQLESMFSFKLASSWTTNE
jgi:hypothetical protein